jgi:hypothetical protein
LNSVIDKKIVSPILEQTSNFATAAKNRPFEDKSNDGIFSINECMYEMGDKRRNMLVFEADIINMMGLGSMQPAALHGFIRDFLINREK